MKKRSLICAAVAAVLSWACQSAGMEESGQSATSETETFKILRINGSGSESKTAYDGEIEFSWSPDDQVSVLCNDASDNVLLPFTVDTPGASSSKFSSALVPSTYEMGPVSGLTKMALYPAGAHTYSDDGETPSVDYVVPAVRDFRAASGGHPESAIPMFAWGNDHDTYIFGNMTGAVKFSFTGLMVSQVKFVFKANKEKMSGRFPLTGLGGSYSNVSWAPEDAADETEKTLTFYADLSDLYEEVCFYVPYPTGTISAGSSVRLEDAGGGFVIFENDNLKAIPVEKNRITVTPLQTLPTPSLQLTLNYEDAEGEVKNPERGLYDHVILHYAGGSTPSNLNGTDDNNSLVFTHFYLDDFKNNGSVQDISDAALTAIGQVLETVRTAGKKAIVRFAYDEENYMDAGPAGILRHLEQLSPVLHANEDVIYVVQAGFLGRWGGMA